MSWLKDIGGWVSGATPYKALFGGSKTGGSGGVGGGGMQRGQNQQPGYRANLGSLYSGQWDSGDREARSPWDANQAQRGSGARGLPKVFGGWNASSRAMFPVSGQYVNDMQPAMDLYKGQMDTDWASKLYGIQKGAVETQFGQARQQQQQGQQRAGTTGGATVSPMFQHFMQTEAAARSGQLGDAARLAVLQAEQMKSQAAQNYMNTLSQRYQAQSAPMMLQAAKNSQSNIGSVGPGMMGPAMSGAGQFLGAAV